MRRKRAAARRANRYLAAGSTAGSCPLESADDGTAFDETVPNDGAPGA
jgi:hypothetical protein